jgi:hypothetical protein
LIDPSMFRLKTDARSNRKPSTCIEDHLAHVTVGAVQRVAGSGVVFVGVIGPVGDQIIGAVVDSFEAVKGALLVAFRRVVIDHVQNDLDTGPVKGLDHGAELVVLLAHAGGLGRGVSAVRREKAERHIAPVVAFLEVELEHGHQLHHRHSQLFQVWNLLDHAGKRAPVGLADAGIWILREPSHVELIDDRIRFVTRPFVAAPVVNLLARDNETQRRLAGVRPLRHRGSPVERRREKNR